MPRIATDGPGLALINTFVVAPERCDELIECLVTATREVMVQMPGFVSASFHVNEARDRVVNYAQWQNRDAFESMLQNPLAKPHMAEAARIAASFEPVLYRVVAVEPVD